MIDGVRVTELLAHADVDVEADVHDVIAPFTGQVLFRLPLSTELDVDRSMSALREGQRSWAALPIRERSRIMLRFHDLLLERRDEAIDIVQWETGKTRLDAHMELLDVAVVARHYARDARRLLRDRRHRGALPVAVGVEEVRHPKGVVGVIAPWNYPLTLAASDAVPALLAGNAVLLKPDLQTSLSALWVLSLLREAGLPDDAMRIVTGDGPGVGGMVIDRVDYVQFTGSTAVGRIVARRCGERLIGCSLELGGKNAMVIRGDADPRRAAAIAERACFSNAGQLCISMERIYVHQDVYDAFVAAFVARVSSMRLATAPGWGADMGVLTSARQLAKVQSHVQDALDRGATLLAGGRARPDVGPFAFEPTVLTDVTDDMLLCDEETFGPVVAITRVRDDEEAVRLANATPYGLNASVVGRSTTQARALARRLRAGSVNVNEGFGASWGSVRAPMGGMGDSGIGRRHGDEGLLKFTESQTIATQRAAGFDAPDGWSDERFATLLTTAIGLMKRIGYK